MHVVLVISTGYVYCFHHCIVQIYGVVIMRGRRGEGKGEGERERGRERGGEKRGREEGERGREEGEGRG